MNLHRVGAFIYAFNTPSWRLFEKIGAVRELTLRDHIERDGEVHDVYGYGLLRSEYEAFRREHAGFLERSGVKPLEEGQATEGEVRERA